MKQLLEQVGGQFLGLEKGHDAIGLCRGWEIAPPRPPPREQRKGHRARQLGLKPRV